MIDRQRQMTLGTKLSAAKNVSLKFTPVCRFSASMRGAAWPALILLLGISGCSRKSGSTDPAQAIPATGQATPESAAQDLAQVPAEQLLEKQQEVDTLYITEDGNQITAPGNRLGAIVDPSSGKLAWAAWECDNPLCPERKNGKPLLFPRPDPFYFAKPDGTVGARLPASEAELLQAQERAVVKCPACLKVRNLASETAEQRLQYQLWCRAHILPQAVEQRKQLTEEYQRRMGTHP